jgi:futalosine hydrolase
MHILLAAATTFENQPTIGLLLKGRTPSSNQTNPLPLNRISTLITGVGSLPTTWSLMRQIDRDRPDLIIQAGIAGSFTGKPHGQVLAIRDESLADLGVWEDQQFKSLFDLNLADPDHPPFTAGLLVNPYQSLLALTGLEPVSSVTVNEISTQPGRIAWYRENTFADVESMEGGALHYVSLQERIAFLQIRSVSNDIGIRDRSKWNIPLAIQRLNDRLVYLLQELDYKDTTILNSINGAS